MEESAELAARLQRLRDFTESTEWNTLSADEQERLSRQETIMNDYLGVLRERIAAFTA